MFDVIRNGFHGLNNVFVFIWIDFFEDERSCSRTCSAVRSRLVSVKRRNASPWRTARVNSIVLYFRVINRRRFLRRPWSIFPELLNSCECLRLLSSRNTRLSTRRSGVLAEGLSSSVEVNLCLCFLTLSTAIVEQVYLLCRDCQSRPVRFIAKWLLCNLLLLLRAKHTFRNSLCAADEA